MSKFLLPFKFKGVMLDKNQIIQSGSKLVSKPVTQLYLGEDVYSQFSTIYTDILQAISENDQEYLQQIMEPRLYNRTVKGINEILEQGYNINYIQDPESNPGQEIFQENFNEETEQNEQQQSQQQQQQGINKMFTAKFGGTDPFQYKENDMKIYLQAKGVFGVNIQRHLNQDRKYFSLKGRFSGREYFFNTKDFMQVYNNQILILNVFFRTTRNLYITDEEGDVIQGSDQIVKDKLYRHKWRFESYIPNLDWVLTDMDDTLHGNPYIDQPHTNERQNEE